MTVDDLRCGVYKKSTSTDTRSTGGRRSTGPAMTSHDQGSDVEVTERLLAAARNATTTCLGATADDRAAVLYDGSTRPVAAALERAFEEIGTRVSLVDVDAEGRRPMSKLPPAAFRSLEKATVSAMALTTQRGELSARRELLETVAARRIRHAHMPSITPDVFADGLAMDYREIARFIDHLDEIISSSRTIRITSAAGTDLECRVPAPPMLDKLDGLIRPDRWQNLPSGQIIVYPESAEGVFVADRNIGDWFEHKYDAGEHPVTLEFESGSIRTLRCDNARFERDLSLFVRSSENSNRISELVVGANLGLTQGHAGALFDGYRPGASISVGALPAADLGWSSATFLPIVGRRNNLLVDDREILANDTFSDEILEAAGVAGVF